MLRVYADWFMELREDFLNFEIGVYYQPDIGDESHLRFPEITDDMKGELATFFGRVAKRCDQLGLPALEEQFRRAVDDLPETYREFRQLHLAFESALKTKIFFKIDGSPAQYFEGRDSLLSDAARAAFPTSQREISRAARSYAFELPGACVFHCMGALEPALLALAKSVRTSVGVDSWQTVIERIESKITTRAKKRRGTRKNARLEFLSKAAKEFTYFKDGWRNHVSHGRADYDPTEARRVMDHVIAFIDHISTQLHDQGRGGMTLVEGPAAQFLHMNRHIRKRAHKLQRRIEPLVRRLARASAALKAQTGKGGG